MAKQEINRLIGDVMATNQKKSIQKVVPVKELLKKIKLKALQEEESIKNIINKALENYLKIN